MIAGLAFTKIFAYVDMVAEPDGIAFCVRQVRDREENIHECIAARR